MVLVGCGHSSVERVVEAAEAFTGRRVHLLAGGYHLLPFGVAMAEEVAERLHTGLGVARVAPSHCTGHLGMLVLREVYAEAFEPLGLGSSVSF